jgi:putative ABC transport system permease protein
MSTLLFDLRYGMRMLVASPRHSLTAVLSLALGIGANTAIFSVMNAVMLRPLPYADPDRLVMVWETSPDNQRRWVAPANFLDWRRGARSFEQLAAYDLYSVNLTRESARPERLRAASTSGNFFSTLHVQPAIGRLFSSAEDASDAARAAVLSHALWQGLFGGSRAVVGQTITIDGTPHVILGVAPASFQFLPDVEIYTSGDRGVPRTSPFPGDVTQVRDAHLIFVLGRLTRDATVVQAQAEMATIMRRLERDFPDTNTKLGARVASLHEDLSESARPALLLLLGAVGFLLLIACVNVANLLLARAVSRHREMAIRIALGASRARLVQQTLTEAALLGLAGGASALVLSSWSVQALLALAPPDLLPSTGLHVDTNTLAFTLAVSLVTSILFGIIPALLPSRTQPHADVEGVRTSEGRRQRRFRNALVVSELALAQLLLAGAGLLIASFVNVQHVNLGFSAEHLLAVELTMPPGKYADPARKLEFNRSVLERLASLPGVDAAAASLSVPLRGAINRGIWFPDRPEPAPGQQPNVDFIIVSPSYFRTLGIPLLRGRTFTEDDRTDAPPVAIVSATMASQYWPGENPIGRRLRFGSPQRTPCEVIGVVGDVRQRDPERPPEPLVYIPYQQDLEPWNFIAFALRTERNPASIAAEAREAVLKVDPDQPVSRIRTLDEIAGSLRASRRFNTALLTLFAGLALVLAAIGTYGVMAYSVTRRTREIGLRMALGARPGDVLGMVMTQGASLVLAAIGIGLAGALATNRLLARQLFGVTTGDPAALVAAAVMLCLFAMLACYVPARRAMRIEPLAALRQE